MSMPDLMLKEPLPRAAIDEASAWLALLHGPHRSARIERGFRRWLETDPVRKAAFESVSAMWEASGNLQFNAQSTAAQRPALRVRVGWATAAAAVAGILIVALLYSRSAGISTALGEQRTLTLDDGTRISLNTNTRVRVHYDEHRRRVDLQSGEALFEVASEGPDRPFVVTAGTREIMALGTTFVVRYEAKRMDVILVEGKVAVSALSPAPSLQEEGTRPVILSPGERLTFADHRASRVDRPAVEALTAWRRGRVEFDDIPLAEAAAEMNRYSRIKLAVEPSGAAILVRGSFRAGDSASFAAAMKKTCRLQVIEKPHELRLAGPPSPNCR